MATRQTTQPPAEVREAAAAIAEGRLRASDAAYEIFREYSREKPEVVALWAFGIGFVLGWKLKFW
jgi:hypothetical protein